MVPTSSDSPFKPDSLKKQLEAARFERALEVAESLAEHRALLTTTELARINNILTGKNDAPWRQGPVTLTLPSGKTETLALIADPIVTARDKLHGATALAEGGNPLEAAVNIYVDLVLAHVFADANRRSAVLAAQYFLKRYNLPLSGIALHELGLGDIREPGQVDALKQLVSHLIQFQRRLT